MRDRTLLPLQNEADDSEETHLNNYFVPECTATEYNYFEYNCDVLTTEGEYEVLEDGIATAVQNEAQYYYFKVSESLDFQTTYDTLMAGDLANVIKTVNDSGTGAQLDYNTYVYSDDVNRVLIVELSYQ